MTAALFIIGMTALGIGILIGFGMWLKRFEVKDAEFEDAPDEHDPQRVSRVMWGGESYTIGEPKP